MFMTDFFLWSLKFEVLYKMYLYIKCLEVARNGSDIETWSSLLDLNYFVRIAYLHCFKERFSVNLSANIFL